MSRVRRRKRKSTKMQLILIFLAALMVYCTFWWNFSIAPNLDEISAVEAKAAINKMINTSAREQFATYGTAGDLLLVQTNAEGQIEMVQANTYAINSLLGKLTRELQEQCEKAEAMEVDVPLGSILGSKVLSEKGPDFTLKVLPHSVSAVDFRTEFESQGINQTKYKVYVVFNTEAKVLAPFTTNHINIDTTILVAETVILGRVPNSYVYVPENDLLDGLDSNFLRGGSVVE